METQKQFQSPWDQFLTSCCTSIPLARSIARGLSTRFDQFLKVLQAEWFDQPSMHMYRMSMFDSLPNRVQLQLLHVISLEFTVLKSDALAAFVRTCVEQSHRIQRSHAVQTLLSQLDLMCRASAIAAASTSTSIIDDASSIAKLFSEVENPSDLSSEVATALGISPSSSSTQRDLFCSPMFQRPEPHVQSNPLDSNSTRSAALPVRAVHSAKVARELHSPLGTTYSNHHRFLATPLSRILPQLASARTRIREIRDRASVSSDEAMDSTGSASHQKLDVVMNEQTSSMSFASSSSALSECVSVSTMSSPPKPADWWWQSARRVRQLLQKTKGVVVSSDFIASVRSELTSLSEFTDSTEVFACARAIAFDYFPPPASASSVSSGSSALVSDGTSDEAWSMSKFVSDEALVGLLQSSLDESDSSSSSSSSTSSPCLLSGCHAMAWLRGILLPVLLLLQKIASRVLLSAIQVAAFRQPRALCDAVLIPLLSQSQSVLSASQGELVHRLIKEHAAAHAALSKSGGGSSMDVSLMASVEELPRHLLRAILSAQAQRPPAASSALPSPIEISPLLASESGFNHHSVSSMFWNDQLLLILTSLLTFNPHSPIPGKPGTAVSPVSMSPAASTTLLNADLMLRCLERLELCADWASASPKFAQTVLALVAPTSSASSSSSSSAASSSSASVSSSSVSSSSSASPLAALAAPHKARWLQLAGRIKSFMARTITQHVQSLPT